MGLFYFFVARRIGSKCTITASRLHGNQTGSQRRVDGVKFWTIVLSVERGVFTVLRSPHLILLNSCRVCSFIACTLVIY